MKTVGYDGMCGAPRCAFTDDCRYSEVEGGDVFHLCDLHLKMVLHPEIPKNQKLRVALGLPDALPQGTPQNDITPQDLRAADRRAVHDNANARSSSGSHATKRPRKSETGPKHAPVADSNEGKNAPSAEVFDPFED